jgi:TRAP-type transport system periplasmic protein
MVLSRKKTNRGGCIMKKVLMIAVVGLVALGLWLPIGTYAAEKEVKLEFISAMAGQHPITVLYGSWAKQVEQKTNGGIKITVHPSGTLVAPQQGYDSVVKGIGDMAWHPTGFNPGRFPLSELLDMPIGSNDNLVTSKIANEFYNKFKPKELDDVKFLFFGMSPPYYIHTKKPVKTFEDLKGMKLKVFGSTQADYVTALGAVPVSMSSPETYDSINKGIVEGFVGSYEVLKSFKLNEVVSYTVESPRTAIASAGMLVVNKKKWDSIPPNNRTILEQMINELAPQVVKAYDQGADDAKVYAVKAGHHVYTLPAAEDEKWAARVKPVLDREVKERVSKGLPAQDALNFIQDSLKKTKK